MLRTRIINMKYDGKSMTLKYNYCTRMARCAHKCNHVFMITAFLSLSYILTAVLGIFISIFVIVVTHLYYLEIIGLQSIYSV